MSPRSATIAPWGWIVPAALILAVAAVPVVLTASRSKTISISKTERPRARGIAYERHVLAPAQLPHTIRSEGGRLKAHPRIRPRARTVAAAYFQSPKGHGGGAQPDGAPHPAAPARWQSRPPGGYRVPDAIATFPGGRQVLIEIKCPSPWLTFGEGSPWSAKMQAAFGAQATAFLTWGAAGKNREVRYLFCGLIPPWAAAIIEKLEDHLGVEVDVLEGAYAGTYPPARAFLSAGMFEALTAATLGTLAELAPEELLGAPYDQLED